MIQGFIVVREIFLPHRAPNRFHLTREILQIRHARIYESCTDNESLRSF